jgi:uncharacterized protein involved in response to NO
VPAILSYGFRPFFLAGALYAALAIPLWLAMLFLGGMPTGAFVGPAWHAHEMIFGFLSAVVAGFVLTAVPNWTGRLPISGMPLLVLLCAWLAGRAVAYLPLVPPAAAIVDLLFPFLLAAAIWREVLVGKNHKNVPIAVLISLFGAANLLDYLGIQFTSLSGYGVRLALGTAATLIALVGGRITPSFTRNWMARGQMQPLPAPTDRLDTLALTVTATASLVWVLIPDELATGVLLIAAAALLLLRLARWRGWRTLRSPIVAVLHLGYLWLAVALLLNGLAIIFPDTIPVPPEYIR